MKMQGATKAEIDQMNLYFDKYYLEEACYAQVYKGIQWIIIEKRRRTVIKKLEDMGYRYSVNTFNNGEVYGHTFTLEECKDGDTYIIHIEDHRDDPNVNDFLIFSGIDSGEKDWFGKLIKTEGCIEYSAMKLIMEFIDILKGEER
jgi:hypothetical protein